MDHLLSEQIDCVLFLLDNEYNALWRQILGDYLHTLEGRAFAATKENA